MNKYLKSRIDQDAVYIGRWIGVWNLGLYVKWDNLEILVNGAG
jgi:hypothetical protein